jgi:hypothetical protein
MHWVGFHSVHEIGCGIVELGFVEVLKVCGFPRADSFNRGHDRKALLAMIKTSALLPLASRVL